MILAWISGLVFLVATAQAADAPVATTEPAAQIEKPTETQSAATPFTEPAAKPSAAPTSKPSTDWKFVEKRLKHAGFKPAFIKTLKANYDSRPYVQILELNTLLFLKKSDYHGPQVTPSAVTEVRQFLTTHRSSLLQTRKRYGVPSEVVASLLWMESRLGRTEGDFHVASVFLDLLQADRPAVLRHLHTAALKYAPVITRKIGRDIDARAKRRVAWALSELKALARMQAKDKSVVAELRGSFAGAFGMPQFLPSSYVNYAVGVKKSAPAPDLELAEDAVASVANYLHKSGWKNYKQNSYTKALMNYNNSRDYAAAILNLAEQSAPEGPGGFKRGPASSESTAW